MNIAMNHTQPVVNGNTNYWLAVAAGVVAFVAGLIWAPERAWAGLLVVSLLLIGIGVGAAFFISALYCSGASWAVALRRVPEALISSLYVGAGGLVFVLLVHPDIYPWVEPTPALKTLLIGFKGWWLDRWFFFVRSVAYLGLWIILSRAILNTSRAQDHDGEFQRTLSGIRRSGLFLGVFAVTFWLAAIDWIMSLEPEWYSTIFGIYSFAGWFLTSLTVITLLVVWLELKGPLHGIVTRDHLHDIGKLVFAFSTFWVYIWFSQYMLIWYANLPEEVGYFELRHQGIWGSLALLNLFLNWVVPFFVLLSRRAKRDPGILARVCSVLIVGRILDVYLMIVPAVVGPGGAPSLIDAGLLLGGFGGLMVVFLKSFGAVAPVPVKDPLLEDSLAYHQ